MNTRLSIKEKIGYGLGDTASNIVFQVVINFMMIFYTDVFGISAAAVGTMMLVLRLFDGVTDPVMGAIADRTKSRWGRYRPYLIWASLPYAILAILAFTTPNFSEQGKLIYAYITYALLMTVYTVINIPYSALGGVLTDDPRERASVQSYRFALAMVGGAIVTAATLPMVNFFGPNDNALGFQLTLGVLSSIAVVCFWLCFYFTKERVEESQKKPVPILRDVKSLLTNRQWIIAALIAVFMLVLVAMRSAATPYYMTYYMEREDLVAMFFTTAMAAGVVGALCTNYLSRYMCKITLFKLGILGVVIFHAVLFFLPPDKIILAFAIFMLANFSQLIAVPVMFSMIPDTVDYGALKTGRKNMGLAFSAHLLAIKFGLALGGALTGWMLSYWGYIPNTVQTTEALFGIRVVFALSAVVCGVLVLIVVAAYRLDARAMEVIHEELADKKQAQEETDINSAEIAKA